MEYSNTHRCTFRQKAKSESLSSIQAEILFVGVTRFILNVLDHLEAVSALV